MVPSVAPSSDSTLQNGISTQHEKQQSTTPALEHESKTSTDTLLSTKITSVLRNWGYTEAEQRKVGSLVAANTVHATTTCIPKNESGSDVDGGVGALIDSLLDPNALEERCLRLNSNEIVLLIQTPKTVDRIKDGVLDLLRERGIRPVRVYVRVVDSTEESEEETGASLLNVVNTDIGGPGMVQLLDAAFHGEEWKEDLVLKEAWNGFDLLWRDEVRVDHTEDLRQRAAAETETSEREHEAQLEPEAVSTSEPALQTEEERRDFTGESLHPVDVHPKTEHEEDPVPPIEHPAMKVLREIEAEQSGIEHPTWSREHESQSVLDVIMAQSAGLKSTDPESLISQVNEHDGVDDSVLVEKP